MYLWALIARIVVLRTVIGGGFLGVGRKLAGVVAYFRPVGQKLVTNRNARNGNVTR